MIAGSFINGGTIDIYNSLYLDQLKQDDCKSKKVENGKIVGRVKDTMISGNVYQVLEKVEAIGRDARWVGNFLLTPPVYCSGLSVASK